MSKGNWTEAYPEELRAREKRRVDARPGREASRPLVGFAVSGGGIRSATFALGVFQALARQGLLPKIDFLSTVSGGGYFGAFLGRLFRRKEIRGLDDVRDVLLADKPVAAADPAAPLKKGAFRWLRDNGRYLSPKGSGDLLLGSAVLLRNWTAVHVVLGTLVLVVMLAAQFPRIVVETRGWWPSVERLLAGKAALGHVLWWSPYVFLPGLAFVLLAIPFGWAYWLVVRGSWRSLAIIGALLATVAPLILTRAGVRVPEGAGLSVVVVGLLTLFWFFYARWRCRRLTQLRDVKGGDQRAIFRDGEIRNWLSSRLKIALIVTAGLFGFALIDSFGQTLYLMFRSPGFALLTGGGVATLAGLAAAARRIVVSFGGRGADQRAGLSVTVLATLAAFAIILVVLSSTSALSHAIAWQMRIPGGAPVAERPAVSLIDAPRIRIRGGPAEWTLEPAGAGEARGTGFEEPPPPVERRGLDDLRTPFVLWLVALAFTVLFGRSWPFLNRSSHHPLYAARLIRAYLGASNPRRFRAGGTGVTQVIPGDDIELDDYWPELGDPCEPHRKGAPLHLINVTINETVDKRNQIQQQDRKGLNMAVGPCGLSVDVKHHAVFRHGSAEKPRVYPEAPDRYRVFDYRDGHRPESLSLGRWVGISGAAFSTGVGSRTNLGLSLLTGFGNVRLGYWWDSGVQRTLDRGDARLAKGRWSGLAGRLAHAVLPVQSFLLDEFLARFVGTWRRHWYLSDGGHFENMGGYELIRRRLPLIVVVDAEADPQYRFQGLANLVRKARLDFGAEIRFLDEDELKDVLSEKKRPWFGRLDRLRRNGESELSQVHAGLARVSYEDRMTGDSWLVYIKPSLCGDDPTDVAEYRANNPTFPQETTGDQFFDEAQWESYRRLGQHIASKLFDDDEEENADQKKLALGRLRPPRLGV